MQPEPNLRTFMALLFPGRERRRAQPCERADCPPGVHYHWGWGQRHWSRTPVTGPGSFSSGRPYIKRGPDRG